MLKKITAFCFLAATLSGCADVGVRYDGMSNAQTTSSVMSLMGTGPYRMSGLGKAISLNIGEDINSLPTGIIYPGMKGKWAGVMENNDQVHSTRNVMLYISGSTKRTGLKKDDLSILTVAPNSCTLGLVYLTTLEDGVVIYRKLTSWNGYQGFCGGGFLRIIPQDDGTLRISDHSNTAEGKEMSAGVFTRAN